MSWGAASPPFITQPYLSLWLAREEKRRGEGKLRKLLIVLGGVVGVVLLGFVGLILLLGVGTQGAIFTGGVPISPIQFTSGDIPGVPSYPGAEQSTESEGVSVPDDMRRVIGTNEAQWKRYLTGDASDQVLAWYKKAIVDAGFEEPRLREGEEWWLWTTADRRYGLYATITQGRTNIILATGLE